jgi:glycosyltransferase involved in cell wall biosynthesis
MVIELAHDFLSHRRGGAERVLLELSKLFTPKSISVLLYQRVDDDPFAAYNIRQSFLGHFPDRVKDSRRLLLPLMPLAVETLKIPNCDVVLSSSYAFIKNVRPPQTSRHLCYCHTPARFLWDYRDRYLNEIGLSHLVTPLAKAILLLIARWDKQGAKRVDYFIASSEHIANRIAKYYGRESTVIYPPVRSRELIKESKLLRDDSYSEYFIYIGALTEYKHVDLAIKACTLANKNLIVCGSGPLEKKLKEIAGSNIMFTGHIDDREMVKLLANAKALIQPNEEDFGIVAVEAQACGTPVIAYGKGGARETVIDGLTGKLFHDTSPHALAEVILSFDKNSFSVEAMQNNALRFDTLEFQYKMRQAVDAVLSQNGVL